MGQVEVGRWNLVIPCTVQGFWIGNLNFGLELNKIEYDIFMHIELF